MGFQSIGDKFNQYTMNISTGGEKSVTQRVGQKDYCSFSNWSKTKKREREKVSSSQFIKICQRQEQASNIKRLTDQVFMFLQLARLDNVPVVKNIMLHFCAKKFYESQINLTVIKQLGLTNQAWWLTQNISCINYQLYYYYYITILTISYNYNKH